MAKSQDFQVAIVGAGPSGLATAASLRKLGLEPVLFEAADRVGFRWHHHYERLHLHTARRLSSLPGWPMPTSWPTYVPRDRFARYLGDYAAHFSLAPRLGVTVSRISREGAGFRLETSDGEFSARFVVVTTGYNHSPHIPQFEGQERFAGRIEHSREYKTGRAHKGQRVLVVGAGNSGAEIALDLWEHGAFPLLAVRGPLHVTRRDVAGIPAQYTAQLIARLPLAIADALTLRLLERTVGDLSRYGIVRPSVGPITAVVLHGKIPLIDVGTIDLVRQGQIEVVPGITHFDPTGVTFSDGKRHQVDHVVLATGYRPALDALFADAAAPLLDARGYPRFHATEVPGGGLFFVGYRNHLTGALFDLSREAVRVAKALRSRLDQPGLGSA